MKKFLMGLLGVFLLFGASILTACGSNGITLTLSKETVEIQLYTEDDESYEIVTAEVSGTDKASISATAKSGYENIVKVTTSKISDTKVSIKIEGLSEGNAEVTVKSGKETKYIRTTVFSEVSEMTQKSEDGNKKNNYLVRGKENILNEEALINFMPSQKSRRTITWSLEHAVTGLVLNGNSLIIDDNFIADNVSLIATTEKGVTTTITLPVLDNIDKVPEMGFAYSKNSSFDQITTDVNTFSIVPNVPSDQKYQGYVMLNYTGDLEITGFALDGQGNETEDILVNQDGFVNGYPVYVIYANKTKNNINQDYKIGFKIGYAQYNYTCNTILSMPINIVARELVNGVIVSTYGSSNIENSTQTLYTSYADSDFSTIYGQEFNVMMIPTTVLDATNKYTISLVRTEAGGAVADGCPIEIWYRDVINGDIWTYLPLIEDVATGEYKTKEGNSPSINTIYIKAADSLAAQTVEGFKITFTSDDNPNISSSFNLKLVKSVAKENFVFPNGDFKIDSSEANVTVKKHFTLKGQTSIEGLYIINDSKNVTFDEIHYISNDEENESVTFEVAVTLNKASYGITVVDNYRIAHKNGIASDAMKIDIFLPLKEVGMYVDMANNKSNSVVDTDFNQKTYNLIGEPIEDIDNESLSVLMLKNNTTTPIIYSYNEINGISAVAKVNVEYYDFNAAEDDIVRFIELGNTDKGALEILNRAKGNSTSNFAYFVSDYTSIITKGVGQTYAVISFVGKATEDNPNVDAEGNVTLVKIIRIESLVTPEGMTIIPEADKAVNLYSIESLATSDEDLTKKDIKIDFTKSNITYKNITNLTFYSRNEVMGTMSVNGDTVSWSNGRYTVSNIKITDSGLSFTIAALHTYGDYIFTDTLDIHYSIYNANDEKVYDISSAIKLTISNAQRIESVVWDNYDPDGLYFELGNNQPQYMLFQTTPTSAKNKSMAYVLTDKDGVAGETFVTVSDTVSDNALAVNLSSKLTAGMIGYMYILPADAIYNNQIKYYYVENEAEKSGYISPNALGAVINNEGLTNYEYLINNAYFKSSVSAGVTKNVEFKNIILKIQVTVADGKSFEHALRIYDAEGFNAILPDRYYTVMTSLEVDSTRESIKVFTDGKDVGFTGGLQGYNSDVTVKFNGSNFANIIAESAEIRNLKFSGTVNANGFIANTNNGKLTNVIVDVDGIKASSLTVIGETNYGGGIVGINNGTISGSKVLGLNITGASSSVIGGIAGQNKGVITGSAVEFYNLLETDDGNGNKTYASNKFEGNVIGAIVGESLGGSSISYTYAYDYTLANESENVIVGNTTAAFAGRVVLGAGETTTIDYSFSVVGLMATYGGSYNENVIITNHYIGYYLSGIYTVTHVAGYESNPNFIQPTDENFDSEVNGGFAYLAELQQPERVTSVEYNVATVENNGYYKSVAVDANNGILFYYSLKNSFVELNNAEQNDLDKLNTITLAQLVGEEKVSENVIITSSNISIVKIVGSSLIVRKTGSVVLTLSSKQNVTLNNTINVEVVSPVSKMQISWTDMAQNVNYVEDEAQLSLQKTRSRDFAVSLYRPQVYLGGLATAYDIVENDFVLQITADIEENAVEKQVTGKKEFKLLSHENSELTTFSVSPKLFEDEIFQNAINSVFTRTFKVLPTEGLISFAISGDVLTISPSINASVKAEIKTTAETDSVYPVVSLNGTKLIMTSKENIYYFTIIGENIPILEAVVSSLSEPTVVDGVTTYLFDVNFAVAEEYKTNIAEELEFDVILMSQSGNSSEEWNGSFTINVSPQEFTNIDISNRKISTPVYKYDASKNQFVEVYTAEKATAVLAPGNSSILEINVNPAYAYYDYVEFTYSGAKVSNAVNVIVVEPYMVGNVVQKDQYARKAVVNNNIENINSKLVYRPVASDKSTIYYKLWINTTVNRDTTLCFTATFYRQNGEVLDFVNYYMTISYLTEPTITVDGASTTYLAKGHSADVKIDVLLDQKVDSLSISGENVQGISLSQLSQPVIDTEKGIKTYTAKVYATVLASTTDNNTFYLTARVSRELNGAKEIKDSLATVVIVDFKLDTNAISIANAVDGNLTIWQGVSKPFMVEYELLPQSYPYPSNPEMLEAIINLQAARASFEENEYYPATATKKTKYLINYIYDASKDQYVTQSLYERLFIVVNNEHYPISDTSIQKPFDVIYDKDTGNVSFKGNKISNAVTLVLKTYITSSYVTQTVETYFTVNVTAYSDPDLPIKISSAYDFKNLNPDGISDGVELAQNDYILENDILLENYTSFNTDLISSLDGNGHTIFIKSFNLEQESATLNLSLFNVVKEYTTLKNVRVNLYNGGQLTINVSKFKNINIAGIAIENAGVITNSEVVSFYTKDRAVGDVLADAACSLHGNPQGINVNYVNANGTDSVYLPDNANWTSQVAGFVIENSGSITNSRVGGEEIIIVGSEIKVDDQSTGYTYASTLTLDTFHIVGQGNVAGFILTNIGYITSSYVKNIDIENQSNSINFYTAGFAGVNNGAILTSYVEGAPTDEASVPEDEYSQYAFEGTSIRSKLGYIVGFIYNNVGSIKDSYSNILIANSTEETRVYYASGFVYMNEGVVENCYSASQIANSKFSQMNFSGVSESGDLLKNGEYINCYFFNKTYEDKEDADATTETQYNTGAQLISKPYEPSAYYGFAVADGENDGIWRKDELRGITLVEANKTTISNRYTYYTDSNFEGTAAEDSLGRKYILPYSVLNFIDTSREIDTSLGGEFNPIIIYDAEDFLEVFGTSKSSYVQQYYNDKVIWGTYRIVNNINLLDAANGEETVVLSSSTKAFAGHLYGNGFTINGISISSGSTEVAFGLFKSIEKRGKETPIVTNLDLVISQVIAGDVAMVGGLAGYIKDSIIINLDIQFEETNSMITGLNFVGGLAGLASGNNIIKNIYMTNPSVYAERRAEEYETNYYFANATDIQLFRTNVQNNLNYNTSVASPFIKSNMGKYSYAGSLIGYVDNYAVDSLAFNINQSTNYTINNIRVSGVVNVQGQVVGGIFGITGYQTNIRDVGLTIDTTAGTSKILSTKYFAGGVIGQSFGGVSRTFAVHDKTTQDTIEDNMSKFYSGDKTVERGQLDLFSSGDANYKQIYIGGLIGYVGSGRLEISYSRLNVTATSAEYAGGVIGGINVVSAATYLTDTKAAEGAYTKYFMHEVYATGDVRANTYAGGVIGVIKGQGSRVALLAVNGFNYLTSYDYDTGNWKDVSSRNNISSIIKANAIVGYMIYINEDGEESVDNVDENTYSSYLTLMKAKEAVANETAVSTNEVASVGYYEGYYPITSVSYRTVNLFGNIDGRIAIDGSTTPLYTNGFVYAIASPWNYQDSAMGHTYTQSGFINSGAWSSDNWVHKSVDLFPEIRYKRSYDVLYLDQYNIPQVLSQMTSSNVRVIVRGRETEDDNSPCYDINLAEDYFNLYGVDAKLVQGFAGIIEGGGGQTDNGDGTLRDVKIITDRTFIESTGPGFSVLNLTIDYVAPEGRNIEITEGNGLLTYSEVSEATISGLTMNVNSPVVFDLKNASSLNVGLIAPKITSTSLAGVTINSTANNSILQVVNAKSKSIEGSTIDELNVGILAGEAIQASTITSMVIQRTKLSIANAISITGAKENGKIEVINAGSYFGKVSSLDETQNFEIVLGSVTNTNNENTENTSTKISVSNPVGLEELYLGGFIGQTFGIDAYSFDIDEDNKTDVEFNINATSENILNSNVYIGGIIAVVQDQIALNGADVSAASEIKSTVLIQQGEVNNLYVGGLIASQPVYDDVDKAATVGPLNINNFTNVDLEIASGIEITGHPDKESLASNYEKFYYKDENGDEKEALAQYVKVNGEAVIGGILGRSISSFNYSSMTQINGKKDAIRLSGKNITVGSVLGEARQTAGIYGNIISSAEYMIKSEEAEGNDINVGGIIGKTVETGNITINGSTSGPVVYQGAVYSNSKDLTFGGMIAKYERSNNTDYLNINKTAFGGVVKIYGEVSNETDVMIGGTLGFANISEGGEVNTIIQNNYNYGDVFVEYGVDETTSVTGINSYTFGGLIGEISPRFKTEGTIEIGGMGKDLGIFKNYSLVTSHNARYSTYMKDTAHALFGNGSPWGDKAAGDAVFENNYYNHAVCLLTDDFGRDRGYTVRYDDVNAFGYGDNNQEKTVLPSFSTDEALTSYIKSQLGSSIASIMLPGHKLSPASVTQMGEHGESTFNGMYYYTYDGQVEQIAMKKSESTITKFENLALIGTFGHYNTDYANSKSLVEELAGYSFISGIARNVKITEEDVQERTYAPLVGTMRENAIVYAVNITGTYELGGSGNASLAGIVGDFKSGKIFDSSTDIDLIYRAGQVNTDDFAMYGIANAIEAGEDELNYKFIENTYSAGSMSSMVKTNMYAFTNGTENTFINNSYTYTKLDPNDYLNAETLVGSMGAFGGAVKENLNNCFYDIDGLDYILIDTNDIANVASISSKRSVITSSTYELDAEGEMVFTGKWVIEPEFNYGYPVLKYQYLKNSSFVKYVSESTQGESGYDKYVKTIEYSRYANGITPASEDKYFVYAPNSSVMFKSDLSTKVNENECAGIVLRYNINLGPDAYTDGEDGTKGKSDVFEDNKNITLAPDFAKIFDGQNKTIKGLTNSLFGSIKNGEVHNLRLTEVELSNTPALIKGDAIHDEISDTPDISNLTLSGNITYNSAVTNNTGYGAIAGHINSIYVATVTNMVNLNVNLSTKPIKDTAEGGTNSKNQARIGGLVGIASLSKINYCSNYGPVRLFNSEEASGWDCNIGGLVGLLGASEIAYSYNAASILGNYANETAFSTTTGSFMTGGLAGYMHENEGDAKIENSYNSGMIKSGNKSNINDGENSYGSYAGGIVGKTSAGSINNCYNEGTIEALGKMPEWEIRTTKEAEEVKSFSLVIKAGAGYTRNVWAYAIGYVSESASIDNVSARLSSEQDLENVKQTGYTFEQEEITLKSWTIDDVYNPYASGEYNEDYGKTRFRTWALAIPFMRAKNHLYSKTEYKIDDFENKLIVSAINQFGLPSRFIVPILKNVYLYNHYTESLHNYDRTNFDSADIKEYGVADFSIENDKIEALGDSYLVSLYSSEDSFSNKKGKGTLVNSDNTELKKSIRSQQEAPVTLENNVIAISGQNYYTVDTNNANIVFDAGTYFYEFSDENDNILEFNNIAYYGSLDNYKLTAHNSAGVEYTGIGTQIKSIIQDATSGNLKVGATLYSSQPFPSDLKLKLEFEYSKNLTFNLSNMDFSYFNDYSFALNIGGGAATKVTDYSLQRTQSFVKDGSGNVTITPTGDIYDKVIKLSLVKYNDSSSNLEPEDLEPEDDENSNFIYLADVGDGKYIYIPNATLHRFGQTDILVNKNTYISPNEKLNATNTKNIINNVFIGKTLYYRTKGVDTIDIALEGKISQYVTANSGNFVAGAEQTVTDTLDYGKVTSTTINDFSVEFVSTGTENYYRLSFANKLLISDGMIAVNGTGTPLLSFSNATGLYFSSSTYVATTSGTTFETSVNAEDNSILFKNYTITEENSTVIADIRNYFNSLSFVSNDFSDTISINDYYPLVSSGPGTILLKDGSGKVYGEVEKTVSKAWYLNGAIINEGKTAKGAYDLTKTGYNLKLSFNNTKTGLSPKYSLNGVDVYNGSISISGLKEKYTTQLEKVRVYPPNQGLYSYTEIKLLKSGSVVKIHPDFIQGSGFSAGHYYTYAILGSDTLSGNYEIKVTYFNTYQEKSISKNETGKYKLALQDFSGNKYYVELETSEGVVNKPATVVQSFDRYALYMNYEDLVDEGYQQYTFTINSGYSKFKADEEEILEFYIRKYTDGTVKYGYYEIASLVNPEDVSDYIESSSIPTIEFDGTNISNKIQSLYALNIESLFKVKTEGDKRYLYTTDFVVLNKLNWRDKTDNGDDDNSKIINVNIEKQSSVVCDLFDWNKIEKDYNYPEVTFITEIEDVETRAIKGSKYEVSGINGVIYLKASNNETIVLELSQSSTSAKLNINSLDPVSGYSIILTRDVSFNNSVSQNGTYFVEENEKPVNLIGNGYYISYYNNPFYGTLQKNGAVFRDVSFLGDLYNKKFLNSSSSINSESDLSVNPIEFINVNLFGVINNFEGDNIITDAVANFSNISSYLSVSGKNNDLIIENDKIKQLSLFGVGELSNCTNYGLITGANGKHGVNGENTIEGSTPEDGTSGLNGQSIVTTTVTPNADNSNIQVINKGIVLPGRGGNGGAGGNWENDASKDTTQGLAGKKGGDAGAQGTAEGFDTSFVAEEAIKGANGADARSAYLASDTGSTFEINTDEDGWAYFRGYDKYLKLIDYKVSTGGKVVLGKDGYHISLDDSYHPQELTDDGIQTLFINCFANGLEAIAVETVYPESVIESIPIVDVTE